ncbi:MAG TPA: AAA family ATPase [Thermodesulfobacteriota bacterium]|nr:AAA family ATPase [Thermodesulfobacteriota bacterium]
MNPNIAIVIIDSDTDSVKTMVSFIQHLGDHASIEGVASNFESGIEMVHKKRPNVVIMELTDGIDDAVGKVHSILERFPRTSIFVTSSDRSADTILKVMKAGATEYILRPITEEDLSSALQKMGRLWITKPAPEAEVGKVYTLFSPKGGVGVTTLAVNLATNVHKVTGKPTVIVDLDLDAGDVTTFLNIKSTYTISDVTTNMSRLDESFMKGVITKHPSGVHVLAEPQNVDEGARIPGSDITKLIELLKTMFDYIIIDTGAVIDERTIEAIKMSDSIMVVLIMSLPGIRHLQRYLKYFDKLGLRDRVKIIVNRYIKKGDIRIEDAEKVLGRSIAFSIPNEYDLAMRCLNKGIPISEENPRSGVNTAMEDISKEIIKIHG